MWSGIDASIKNDGSMTNEQAFWEKFEQRLGARIKDDQYLLDDFYRNEFEQIQNVCGYNEKAARTVKSLKEKGFRVSLATNPLFPNMATESRLRWSGVSREDIEWLGSYENSHYCKPNLAYYKEITDILGVDPTECLMVGNDVGEDMIAEQLGMKVFLLTDCLLNRKGEDITRYPQGSFDELIEYVNNTLENGVELITADHMQIINDKRSKEKNKK